MRRVEKWVEVNAPVSRVFWLFNSLNTFPLWLHGIERVQFAGPRRAHWVAVTPRGARLEWEAETTTFEPNRRLVWQTVSGQITAEGDITFEETKRGSTLLRVVLGYGPSGTVSGAEVAFLMGEDPSRQLEEDLTRFKQLAEQAAAEAAGGGAIRRPAPAEVAAVGVKPPAGAGFVPPNAAPERPVVPRRIVIDPHAELYELPQPATRGAKSPALERFDPRHRRVLWYFVLALLLLSTCLALLYLLFSRTQSDASAVARPTPPAAASPAAASPAPTPPASETPESEARSAIQTVIDNWIAATNARDVRRLVRYYAPTVRRYYLRTDVPRDAVRDDKTRFLDEVEEIKMSIGETQISLGPEGESAEARFRKQYELRRRGKTDRGEVLQELSLALDKRQWRIVSERDLKKLR